MSYVQKETSSSYFRKIIGMFSGGGYQPCYAGADDKICISGESSVYRGLFSGILFSKRHKKSPVTTSGVISEYHHNGNNISKRRAKEIARKRAGSKKPKHKKE
ncbi:MAG: hypothetical protein JW716_04970 [Candidatus Aenigmarchaeota archaeon]|nr:hypothetical protein [Candidatus Aenigmarchaeota archaeon]